jgi:hypothetical protein
MKRILFDKRSYVVYVCLDKPNFSQLHVVCNFYSFT